MIIQCWLFYGDNCSNRNVLESWVSQCQNATNSRNISIETSQLREGSKHCNNDLWTLVELGSATWDRGQKKIGFLLDICLSSLRRGHANLLCIVPILTDDCLRNSSVQGFPLPYKVLQRPSERYYGIARAQLRRLTRATVRVQLPPVFLTSEGLLSMNRLLFLAISLCLCSPLW